MSEAPIGLTRKKLRKLHPTLFGSQMRPLKLGIFDDLMAAYPGQVSKRVLYALLGAHTSQPAYLRSLVAGATRFGLDGAAAGEVSEAEATHAKDRMHALLSSRTEALHRERKSRSDLLKAFEGSGLSVEAFATRRGLAVAALQRTLSIARGERAERQARRQSLVDDLHASGQSIDAFATSRGIPVEFVSRIVSKATLARSKGPRAEGSGESAR